jgi:hypothetical protein
VLHAAKSACHHCSPPLSTAQDALLVGYYRPGCDAAKLLADVHQPRTAAFLA